MLINNNLDKYFKDKNWVYILDWFQWSYKKIDADQKSLSLLQNYYIQDKNCIFVWSSCVTKWISKNITLNKKNIWNKLSIEINYIGEKKVSWITTLDWKGALSWSNMNYSNFPIMKRPFYIEPWNYNFIAILNFDDWTYEYNNIMLLWAESFDWKKYKN